MKRTARRSFALGVVTVGSIGACHKHEDATPHIEAERSSASPVDSTASTVSAPTASETVGVTPAPMASASASASADVLASDAGALAALATRGNMWGDAIGDSFGAGGLGSSTGDAGGGTGATIGLGNIGTIGHGAGTGTGGGFSERPRPLGEQNGHGRLGGGATSSARLRQGAVTVNGRLPADVIQRIVRQNFGRFKLCYAQGLQADPKLTGTVATKFVIDRQGSVMSSATDTSTAMSDASVVACVVRGFSNLSFPQPEGGIVSVVFPIIFEPPATP